MSKSHELGDLQLAIMRVLWDNGHASVAHVHETLLPTRGLALTTIATMLRKMESKGIVTHETRGRQFIYKPTVSEKSISKSMVARLTEKLFAGDTSAMVSHLLTEQQIDPDELTQLKQLIEQKEKELGDSNDH